MHCVLVYSGRSPLSLWCRKALQCGTSATATSVPHSVMSFGVSINSESIVSSRCHAGWLWTYNVRLPLIYGSTQIHLLQPTVSVPGRNPRQEQLKAYIKCHGDLEWKLKTYFVCAFAHMCVYVCFSCFCRTSCLSTDISRACDLQTFYLFQTLHCGFSQILLTANLL